MDKDLYKVDLGRLSAQLKTNDKRVIDYLSHFYELSSSEDKILASNWNIEVIYGQPGESMTLTPWNIGYETSATKKQVTLQGYNIEDLNITARKTIREIQMIYCEQNKYIMLHASALYRDDCVIIIVGDKGSGKTTLALNGIAYHHFQYLSNDHLILFPDNNSITLTSLPTLIPIKIGTYFNYKDFLPEPFENENVDLQYYAKMPVKERYIQDVRLLYTYKQLKQKNPVYISLDNKKCIVVLASYESGDSLLQPEAVNDPLQDLLGDVRLDWVFHSSTNTKHIARTERNEADHIKDANTTLKTLCDNSLVVRWRHKGELAPLLSWIKDTQ